MRALYTAKLAEKLGETARRAARRWYRSRGR